MPRTKGAKNKNINTAKNKNIININVNSSKSKRGRPRKTTANTNTQNRPPTSGGGISMAPPQVIITQPQTDNSNNNSLLSSFITSKMLNETMNLNRTVEPTRIEPTIVEPPRPEPSYFAARESIIPKLPDTPKTVTPRIVIKPSPKIGTKEPPIITEPPKVDIKPADVAPPKEAAPPKKTPPKFYKKLVDNTKDITSQLSNSILEDAIKEVNKEDKAATLIGSVLRGHKGRLNHTYIKKYPELVNKRLEQVKQMDPQNLLQYLPKTGDKGEPLHIQKLKEKLAKEEKRRINDKGKLEKSLSENTIISQDLENKTLKNKAAVKLQNAFRVKKAKNTVADKYIDKQNKAASKIQGIVRGVKTRNKLNTDEDFKNRIDMKIKKYGDAASEYSTRGKDSKKVNEEFSDVIKKMRTGLKDYKATLGVESKKRGPKPKVK
jgi:hypothetical protein